MNGRERLLAALRGQEVDRLPCSWCMDGYFTSSLPAQGYNMDLLETLRFLRNDIMERHVPMVRTSQRQIDIRTETKGATTRFTFETPVGSIYYEHTQAPTTSFVSKHLLETIEDVKVYQYVVEHTEVLPDYEGFVERDNFIGGDGLATPSGPMSPIQELLQHLMGVEKTVYALYDEPDTMHSLFDAMHRLNMKTYQIMAESPAHVVFDYEDTSTTVMSESMYREHTAPCIDAYADVLHDAGKIFITHMCGKLKGFAPLIGRGKMDGIDSLCPPTTGDLWAHEARKIWGENKIIIGGLEPPALARMTEEETVAYTVDVINKMAPGKGFILSSGDAVAHGTPIGNLIRVRDIVERCSFPLKGDLSYEHFA